MIKLLKKLSDLPYNERKLLFQALSVSLITYCVISIFPMKWYQKKLLGRQVRGTESHLYKVSTDENEIKQVAKAVRRCSKYAPWNTKCLVQAITAKNLLRKYNIGSMLVLGVAKLNSSDLSAHAWLKVGDKIITGKKGMQRFTEVSKFI